MPGLKLLTPSAGSNNIEFFNLGLLNNAPAPDIRMPLFGRARDGDLTVSSGFNPNTTRNPNPVGLLGTRTVDAPVAQVTAIDAAATGRVLTVNAVFGVLADFLVGDIVLLINQQGDASSSANVGNYELAVIASVSGSSITLTQAVARTYGPSSNAALGNQKVNIYRIPEYNNLGLSSVMAPSAWNGTAGGCLFVMAQAVICASGGSLSVSGAGYRASTVAGAAGEGFAGGYNAVSTSANGSGGGGGAPGLNAPNAATAPALIANTANDSLSGGGAGGGGGGGGGAGGGGGYGNTGGAGALGGTGGGGSSGMSLSAAGGGGLLVNGGSNGTLGGSTGGVGGAGFMGYVPGGTVGYYGDVAPGTPGGGTTQTAAGSGLGAGQPILTQLYMGGAGGNCGAGGNGGNGGNAGNVTNNALLPNGGNEKRLGSGGSGGGAGGGHATAMGQGGAPGNTGVNNGTVNHLAGIAGRPGNTAAASDVFTGNGGSGGGILLLLSRSAQTLNVSANGTGGMAGTFGSSGGVGVGANTSGTYRNAGGAGGGGAGGGGGGGGAGGTILAIVHNIVSISSAVANGGGGGSGGVGGGVSRVPSSLNTYSLPATYASGAGSNGSPGGVGSVGRAKVIYNWLANVNASAAQAPVDGPGAFLNTTPPAFKVSL